MKKVMMILLAMSLVCILAVGSTMSYLTYTDHDVNVMVVGNVMIDQLEQKREGVTNEKLLPVVEVNGTTKYLENYDMYNHKNIVDYIVSVENTGSEDAYVRTVFAFEMMKIEEKDENGDLISVRWENPLNDEVHLNVNGTMSFGTTDIVIYKDADGNFTTDSTNAVAAYVVGWYLYGGALAKDEVTAPSLLQVYLDKSVGNEFFNAVGNEYEIIVLSQAVQATGFDTASAALTEAFGEVTAEKAAEWFKGIRV